MYLYDHANKARCCYFIFVDIDINLNILPLTTIVVRVFQANCLTFINIPVDVTDRGNYNYFKKISINQPTMTVHSDSLETFVIEI